MFWSYLLGRRLLSLWYSVHVCICVCVCVCVCVRTLAGRTLWIVIGLACVSVSAVLCVCFFRPSPASVTFSFIIAFILRLEYDTVVQALCDTRAQESRRRGLDRARARRREKDGETRGDATVFRCSYAPSPDQSAALNHQLCAACGPTTSHQEPAAYRALHVAVCNISRRLSPLAAYDGRARRRGRWRRARVPCKHTAYGHGPWPTQPPWSQAMATPRHGSPASHSLLPSAVGPQPPGRCLPGLWKHVLMTNPCAETLEALYPTHRLTGG